MNYSTDGFNERTNFIHNSNALNATKNKSKAIDTSVAQMKIIENKSDVKTYNEDSDIKVSERGYKDINQFNLFSRQNFK